jgi:integrase
MEDFREWLIGRSVRKHGRRPSEATLHGKTGRVASVVNIAGAESPKALAGILADRALVERLLDKLYARLQPQTVRGYLPALRDFGDYAIAAGWSETCEIRASDVPKLGPQKAVSVYSDAELDLLRLMARARGNFRFWVLVETLVDTGRRISETLAIRWVDVKLDADTPHFDLPTTKNLRQQYVPLTRHLREDVWTADVVSHLRTATTARLAGKVQERPFPWDYATARQMFRRLCEVSGVEYRGFHCLRHTKATELLARGVPIQAVGALLGHANVATTDRIYNHATALNFARYID